MSKNEQTKRAQKISRKIELACEGDLFKWLEDTQITIYPEKRNSPTLEPVEKAFVVFGDCPWTELEYDAKTDKAYIYVGKHGKARVPQRAIYELREFFSTLQNC